MSGQIRRITDEAGQLAETSASLRALVARFRLDTAPPAVERRPSHDWARRKAS